MGSCLIKEHSFISTTTRIKRNWCFAFKMSLFLNDGNEAVFIFNIDLTCRPHQKIVKDDLNPTRHRTKILYSLIIKKTNRISSFLHVKSRNSGLYLFGKLNEWLIFRHCGLLPNKDRRIHFYNHKNLATGALHSEEISFDDSGCNQGGFLQLINRISWV